MLTVGISSGEISDTYVGTVVEVREVVLIAAQDIIFGPYGALWVVKMSRCVCF